MRCEGQRINSVAIHTSAPTAAVLRRIQGLNRLVSAIHTTTNPDLIRRFMLLRAGDTCDELRRAESERIIRAQPFIAEASVRVVPSDSGGVVLDVQTADEMALILGAAAGPGNPPLRFVRVGDANLNGEGIYAAADWRGGAPFRNGYGGRLVDNQLFGNPYIFVGEAHLTPIGSNWLTQATHPFYTDVQRIAWQARVGADDDYAQYPNDINSSHAIRVTRSYFDVGGLVRLGSPGRLSLFGASISGDDDRPGQNELLVTAHGFSADSDKTLLGRWVDHRIVRANLLWGVRDLGFRPVVGFDALTATQDMPIGFQLGSLFGRSLAALGSRDDDIFMSEDLYVGAVGRNNALRMQVQAEARHSNDEQSWDGILTNARAVQYYKLIPAATSTLSLEFSGGWRQRIPFSLSFSDHDGGLRGYSASNTPGAERFVVRFENRVFVGRPFNLGDLGVGAFADAGRLWAGDIPFGVTTPVRSSVGLSLLGNIPVRSARMWRIDLAYALTPEPGGHRFELRLSNADATRFFFPEPGDVGSTRERTVPSSVFRWPE